MRASNCGSLRSRMPAAAEAAPCVRGGPSRIEPRTRCSAMTCASQPSEIEPFSSSSSGGPAASCGPVFVDLEVEERDCASRWRRTTRNRGERPMLTVTAQQCHAVSGRPAHAAERRTPSPITPPSPRRQRPSSRSRQARRSPARATCRRARADRRRHRRAIARWRSGAQPQTTIGSTSVSAAKPKQLHQQIGDDGAAAARADCAPARWWRGSRKDPAPTRWRARPQSSRRSVISADAADSRKPAADHVAQSRRTRLEKPRCCGRSTGSCTCLSAERRDETMQRLGRGRICHARARRGCSRRRGCGRQRRSRAR